MQPHISFRTVVYTTFFSFSNTIFFVCSGFTMHIISTKYPVSFNNIHYFPSLCAKSAWRYAPGTSNVAICCPSYVSINSVMNRYSSTTVGKATDVSSFKYCLYLLLSAQILSFISPFHFSLIKFTSGKPFFFLVMLSMLGQIVSQKDSSVQLRHSVARTLSSWKPLLFHQIYWSPP